MVRSSHELLLSRPPARMFGLRIHRRWNTRAHWGSGLCTFLFPQPYRAVGTADPMAANRVWSVHRRCCHVPHLLCACSAQRPILADMGKWATGARRARASRSVSRPGRVLVGVCRSSFDLELPNPSDHRDRNLEPSAAAALASGHRTAAQDRALHHHRIAASEVAKSLLTAIAGLPCRKAGLTGTRPRCPVKPSHSHKDIRHG